MKETENNIEVSTTYYNLDDSIVFTENKLSTADLPEVVSLTTEFNEFLKEYKNKNQHETKIKRTEKRKKFRNIQSEKTKKKKRHRTRRKEFI